MSQNYIKNVRKQQQSYSNLSIKINYRICLLCYYERKLNYKKIRNK